MRTLAGARSKTLLFVAFGLLLSVLTALIVIGLARMESFNRQIHALTEAQGRKIGVVSELFLANGQRLSSGNAKSLGACAGHRCLCVFSRVTAGL